MIYILFYFFSIFNNIHHETVVCGDSFLILEGIPIEYSIFVDSVNADSFIEIRGETLYFNKELPDSFVVSYSYIDIRPVYYYEREVSIKERNNIEEYNREEKNNDEIDLKGSRITGIKSDKYGISIVQSTNINIYGTIGDSIYIEGVLSDDKPMEGPFLVRRLGEWNDMYVRLSKGESYFNIGNISSIYGDLTGMELSYALSKNLKISFIAGKNRGKEGMRDIELKEGIMGPYKIYDYKGFYIIPNSVRIYLNGKPLREGKDYEIDYYNARFSFLYPLVPSNGDVAHVVFKYAENNLYPFTIYGSNEISTKIGKFTIAGIFYKETLDTVGMAKNDIMIIETADTTDMIVVDGGVYVGENKGHYVKEDSIYVYKGYNMGNMEVYFTYKGEGNGDYVFSPSIGGFVYVGKGNGDYVSERYISLPSQKKNIIVEWNNKKSNVKIEGGEYKGNVFSQRTEFTGQLKGEINEKYGNLGISTAGYYYTKLYENKDYSPFYKTSKWWIIPRIPHNRYLFNDLFFIYKDFNIGFVYSFGDSFYNYIAGPHIGFNGNTFSIGENLIFQRDTIPYYRSRTDVGKEIKGTSIYANVDYYAGGICKRYYKLGYMWNEFLWKDADIWIEYENGDTIKIGNGFTGTSKKFVPNVSYLIRRYDVFDTLKNVIMFKVGNSLPFSYQLNSSVKYGESYIVHYESVMPGTGDFSYDSISGNYYPDDEGDYIQVTEKINTDLPYIENSVNLGISRDYKKVYFRISGSGSYVKEGNYFNIEDVKKYSFSYSFSLGGKHVIAYDLNYMFYMNKDIVFSMYSENRHYNVNCSYRNFSLNVFMHINRYDYPYSSYYENIKGLKCSFSVNAVNLSPFVKFNNYVSSESKSSTYSIGSDYSVNLQQGKLAFFYTGSLYINRGETEGELPYYLKEGVHWINNVSLSYPVMDAILKGKFSYTVHGDEIEKSMSLLVENEF